MRRPTSKQIAFAEAVVSGQNPTDAYRLAYNCERMSAKSITREALRLMDNPVIAPLIEEGRRKAAEAALWSRETAIERLQSINDVSYTHMTEKRFTDRESATAFFQSLDRLNDMVGDAEPNAPAYDRDVPIIIESDERMEREYSGAQYVELAGSTLMTEAEYLRRGFDSVDAPTISLIFDRKAQDETDS